MTRLELKSKLNEMNHLKKIRLNKSNEFKSNNSLSEELLLGKSI